MLAGDPAGEHAGAGGLERGIARADAGGGELEAMLMHDEADVREKLDGGPQDRRWAIDSRLGPNWWVRK